MKRKGRGLEKKCVHAVHLWNLSSQRVSRNLWRKFSNQLEISTSTNSDWAQYDVIFALNVSSFHSQLAISRENAFWSENKQLKKVKKGIKLILMLPWTPPQKPELLTWSFKNSKQLGLIGRKCRSSSPKSIMSRSKCFSLGSTSNNSVAASSWSLSHTSSCSSSRA